MQDEIDKNALEGAEVTTLKLKKRLDKRMKKKGDCGKCRGFYIVKPVQVSQSDFQICFQVEIPMLLVFRKRNRQLWP